MQKKKSSFFLRGQELKIELKTENHINTKIIIFTGNVTFLEVSTVL